MALIRVSNLNVSFSSHFAVKNISFELNEAETLGVVGESGSGKSLTGLSIIGLLPAGAKVSGNIFFNCNNVESDLLSFTENEKMRFRGKQISMIFQEPMTALNPVMKCGRQVEEILKIHTQLLGKQRYLRVIELFNEVLLPNPEMTFEKYPHQLSGGQRQRIMIAMAIACNPKLIIADEPTTALDVTVQHTVLTLLKSLQQKYKMAMLFISHDLNVISRICDNVMVMYKGEAVEYGNVSDIMLHPKQPYTIGLIHCKPNPINRVLQLPVIEDYITGKSSFVNQIENPVQRNLNHIELYNSNPLLSIRNFNAQFVTKRNFWGIDKEYFNVLKDISIDVWKGETVGLIGESGSGKTTLGRALMHLIEHVEGTIIYNGNDVSKLSSSELFAFRKKVQLVFQDPYSSLNPNHTIGYAILEPMIVHKLFSNSHMRNEKVLELMTLTGLQHDWYHRYPHQLSGGQRQRVVIARALALGPELLICDESVSALDVSIQAQILNLLNTLKEKLNLTFIFISHDLSIVKYISDRIIVLKDGKIIEQAEADELCRNPKQEYTKNLLDAAFNL